MLPNPIKYLFAYLILLFCSINCYAVIIDGKDWMQVSATTNYSWNNMNLMFNTSTGQCDSSECLFGGHIECDASGCGLVGQIDVTDYTWASNEDVNNLAISILGGSGLSSLEPFVADQPPGDFNDTVLWNYFTPTGVGTDFMSLFGLTRESHGYPDKCDLFTIVDRLDDIPDYITLGNYFCDYSAPNVGFWFYKDASVVPLPSAIWLFGSGLIGLIGFACKKKA